MKKEKFPQNRKPSHRWGHWGSLEAQRAEYWIKKKITEFFQMAITSRKEACTLMSNHSEWDLSVEVQAPY